MFKWESGSIKPLFNSIFYLKESNNWNIRVFLLFVVCPSTPTAQGHVARSKHFCLFVYLLNVILVLAMVCDLIVSKVDFEKCNIVHYAQVLSLYFYKDIGE